MSWAVSWLLEVRWERLRHCNIKRPRIAKMRVMKAVGRMKYLKIRFMMTIMIDD